MACWAYPLPIGKGKPFFQLQDIAACAAGLAGKPGRNLDKFLPVRLRLIGELREKGSPSGIRDRFRQAVVPDKVLYLQVFRRNEVLVLDFTLRKHMQVIFPLPCHLPVDICDFPALFLVVSAVMQFPAFFFCVLCHPAQFMLLFCQRCPCLPVEMHVGGRLPVGAVYELDQVKVDPPFVTGLREGGGKRGYLTQAGRKPSIPRRNPF